MTDTLPALTDPHLYAHGDPHAVWAHLRRHRPVSWHTPDGHEPFWAVAGHAAGLEVLTDWSRFTSTRGTVLRPNLSDPFPGAGTMLTLTDPPRHTVLREVMRGLFSPGAVAALRERAQRVAGELVRRAAAAGSCDFVHDVMAPFPLAVTADLLGVPAADLERVGRWTRAASDHIDDIDGTAAQEAHLEVLQYYGQALAERRRAPGDDVVSVFARAQADGLDITDDEIILTCDNLIVAATETTRQVTGSGLLALLEHPDQFAALRAGAVPARRAVEEFLRFGPPISHLMRAATTDTTVAGTAIRAGQAVSVWLPSVNRDEAVFDRPDEFRLDRHPNRHLTFGGGVHSCIGGPIARLMILAVVEELLRGTRSVALDGTPRRIPSHIVCGLASLPVTIRPR
ncbi:cytochrome P450 [Micromonospora sp. NPDC023956]|uniref:cytochrome P450 n=1 Tax=Micromonospora sp. NPDC023956 TaxID=3155722 RepID=UPI003403ED7B